MEKNISLMSEIKMMKKSMSESELLIHILHLITLLELYIFTYSVIKPHSAVKIMFLLFQSRNKISRCFIRF